VNAAWGNTLFVACGTHKHALWQNADFLVLNLAVNITTTGFQTDKAQRSLFSK